MRICHLICIAILLSAPAASAQQPRGPFATQLARECEELMQSAVRRPFGWGWDNVGPASPVQGNAPRHVTLESPGSASAGLLLLWAGELLDEAKFKQAAMDAARGIVASQIDAGKIPEHVLFASSGTTTRDPQQVVPDRSSTTAGLAFLLLTLEAQEKKPEPLVRASQRAAQWLVRQQLDDGAWPSAHPPDVSARQTVRLIRLDTTTYRDSTLALLLSGEMLSDGGVLKASDKAVARLLALRFTGIRTPSVDTRIPTTEPTTEPADLPEPLGEFETARRYAGLWSTAYGLSGSLDPRLTDFPGGADIVSSKFAMQTLIGAYLMTGNRQTGQALDAADRAVSQLRLPNGSWRKLYALQPTTEPAEVEERTGGTFGPPTTQSRFASGTFDLPPTLETVRQLKLVGQTRYVTMLSRPFTLRQRVAAILCGLSEDPFTLDLPISRDEIEPYLRKYQTDFQTLARPMPNDLSGRLRRIWLLLIRAKLEQMQQA